MLCACLSEWSVFSSSAGKANMVGYAALETDLIQVYIYVFISLFANSDVKDLHCNMMCAEKRIKTCLKCIEIFLQHSGLQHALYLYQNDCECS